MRTIGVAFAVLALSLVSIAASTKPAKADTFVDLGGGYFGSLVLDPANDQVFASGGLYTSTVKAVSFDGEVNGTISGLSGPIGMAVVGSTLYVVEYDDDDIVSVDTSTYEISGTLTNDIGFHPASLAFAGSRLWTNGNDAGLHAVNPANGNVTHYSGANYPQVEATFATHPTDAAILVAAHVTRFDDQGPTVRVYDTSTSPPTLLRSRTFDGPGVGDVAFTADGGTILLARGNNEVEAISYANLTTVDAYPSGDTFAHAIAATSAGGGFVAVGNDYSRTDDIFVYPQGSDAARMEYDIGGLETARRDGLAFSPDGNTLFAVVSSSGNARLLVLDDPTLYASTVTLSVADHTPVTQPVQLSGVLAYADGADVAGQPIEIWHRTQEEAGFSLLDTAVTDASGSWALDVPTTADDLGGHVYQAIHPGDASHRAGTSTADGTFVDLIFLDLSLSVPTPAITVGEDAVVHIHMADISSLADPTVQLYADPANGPEVLVGDVQLDANGDADIVVQPRYNTRFQARRAGDETHWEASSTWELIQVRAITNGRLSRHARTAGRVHIYRPGVDPRYAITVQPSSVGKEVRVELQRKTSSGWRREARASFELGSRSRVVLIVNGSLLVRRALYRIQARYLGGNRNLPDSSPWAFLKVA